MQFRTILSLLAIGVSAVSVLANDKDDVLTDTTQLGEVVVTGSRSATDVRHLPMTVCTIGRERLLMNERTSVLPAVMEEVPGVVVTSLDLV